MRRLILIAALMVTVLYPLRVSASVYYVNLNEPGGVPGTGSTTDFVGPCYCGTITEVVSPIFHFPSGSTVNFMEQSLSH